MIFELWDTRSTNIINAYDNGRDALALVLSGIERNGPNDTDTLVLVVEDDNGDTHLVAQGEELAEMARREFARQRVTG